MADVETRELRFFVAVAEELHFGRAAARLGMAQPPLSRAISGLEHRMGVRLFARDRRGTDLTDAGRVLLREARSVLDALALAVSRTQREAAGPARSLILAARAGAFVELLPRLLDVIARDGDAPPVEVLLSEIGEQAGLLRRGRADAALLHQPYDDSDGFETRLLGVEGQLAVLPGGHPLASRAELTLADVADLPDLPVARWPRPDGSYGVGPGPEIHSQAQLDQLVALGRVLPIVPASSRGRRWPDHVAIPVVDVPDITSVLAWPADAAPEALAPLLRAVAVLHDEEERAVLAPPRSEPDPDPT